MSTFGTMHAVKFVSSTEKVVNAKHQNYDLDFCIGVVARYNSAVERSFCVGSSP
jgi:hypothetical protein